MSPNMSIWSLRVSIENLFFQYINAIISTSTSKLPFHSLLVMEYFNFLTRVIWKVLSMASTPQCIDKMLSNNTFLENRNQRLLDSLIYVEKGLGVNYSTCSK